MELKESYEPVSSSEEVVTEEEPVEEERDYSHGLFTDSDFLEEPKEEKKEIEKEDSYDSTYKEYEAFAKKEEELERRVFELELENLRKDMELEISRKIKQNGILDGLAGALRLQTEETLHKVYYDILINEDKYKALKENSSKEEDE